MIIDTDRNKKLFFALQKLAEEDKIFLRSDISRKSVAEMLKTNEKYLHNAIKSFTGLAFSDYINLLRVEHAADMLVDNPQLTVEEIGIGSGFGSRSSFYRQFTEVYGTAPDKF